MTLLFTHETQAGHIIISIIAMHSLLLFHVHIKSFLRSFSNGIMGIWAFYTKPLQLSSYSYTNTYALSGWVRASVCVLLVFIQCFPAFRAQNPKTQGVAL